MVRVRHAKIDIQHVVFQEIYTRMDDPKGQRKAFLLLEAAISCYARRGLDGVTAEMVAREAGVTRTLLNHYFEDMNDLRLTCLKYIRVLFQKLAITAIGQRREVIDQLHNYVESCFHWCETFRPHVLVWLAFLQQCGSNKASREVNTLATSVGQDRISALIEKGVAQGSLKSENIEQTAKILQSLITGAIVVMVSENLENKSAFKSDLHRLWRQHLGVSS
jgi:AcrR family transcriptional regulator